MDDKGSRFSWKFFPHKRLTPREISRIGERIGRFNVKSEIDEESIAINRDLVEFKENDDRREFLMRVNNDDCKDLLIKWIYNYLIRNKVPETPEILADLYANTLKEIANAWEKKEFDHEPNLFLALLSISDRVAENYARSIGHGPEHKR